VALHLTVTPHFHMRLEYSVNPPPTISVRSNIWITVPIGALIVAILTANLLLLNYVHVFTSMLWTGTDIFMAFLLGPILRGVSLSTRKEVISWLMPKMVFYMPTVASVTTTAGYFLASKMGLITLQTPVLYWITAVLIIVVAMLIQGLGILLPTNLRVYYELRKSEPDMARIQRLMRRYVKVVATQAILQFVIIFIMANFATGFFLRL
ncbi:MAG TPA: hypothetical protein VNB68_03595, partial [Nitrososphaeraceae archaeon]|nr:hypothetical protein [Nitrososphaeraceae archaeon]